MKLILWWLALAIGIVAVLLFTNNVSIPSLAISRFWIMTISAGLFAIAGLIKQ